MLSRVPAQKQLFTTRPQGLSPRSQGAPEPPKTLVLLQQALGLP